MSTYFSRLSCLKIFAQVVFIIGLFFAPTFAPIAPLTPVSLVAQVQAAELRQDTVSFYKAEVIAVISGEEKNVPGTDVKAVYQTIQAKIIEGEKTGTIITITDDYLKLEKGDIFYVRDTFSPQTNSQYYSIAEAYRLPTLIWFAVIFIALVLLIGGWQGIRGLMSLAGSLLLIIGVLLPGILHGYSPILVSVLVSSIIIVIGSYITHGFTKTTSSAVLGMIVTVIVTGVLAFIAVHTGHLSGYGSDDVVYLNLNSRGQIDVLGILMGGIMIGLLGVLYDVAIGQAISVEELHTVAPHLPRRTIYTRALRMGREHIGALVNTLAIAYVGASLPLFLLFSQTSSSVAFTLNREVFAEEIIRILVGSIGLVLAVPVTTLIAVYLLVHVKKRQKGNQGANQADSPDADDQSAAALSAHTHVHSHHLHGHRH